MHNEIERKFLINEMPRLFGIKKVLQERYFIQRGDLFEEGLKRKDSIFEYESKFVLSKNERTREKITITKEEFDTLKERGTHILFRESYTLSQKSPIVSIKKYKGIYRGLTLAEVEFDSISEMESFVPFDWMGMEVTDTPLGKDSLLIDLDKEKFKSILLETEEKSKPSWDSGSFL